MPVGDDWQCLFRKQKFQPVSIHWSWSPLFPSYLLSYLSRTCCLIHFLTPYFKPVTIWGYPSSHLTDGNNRPQNHLAQSSTATSEPSIQAQTPPAPNRCSFHDPTAVHSKISVLSFCVLFQHVCNRWETALQPAGFLQSSGSSLRRPPRRGLPVSQSPVLKSLLPPPQESCRCLDACRSIFRTREGHVGGTHWRWCRV